MLGTVHCALCCLGWSGLARRAAYANVLSHAIVCIEVNDGTWGECGVDAIAGEPRLELGLGASQG